MLLSGRVKGYGTPAQHQFNLRCGWDELSVFVFNSCVRFVSLDCNYCPDSPSDILLIHQCLVYAKALGGSDGNRWVSVHLHTLIILIITLLDFVWTYCRPMIPQILDWIKGLYFCQIPKFLHIRLKKKKKSEMVIIHPNINKTTWWAHWKEKGLYWNGIGVCFADCVRTRSADGIFSLLIIKGFRGYSFWRLALCIYHLAAHCETAYISTTFASSAASQTCF